MTLEHIADLEHKKFYVENGKSYVYIKQELGGIVDESNSTHTPLSAAGVYTGTAVSILPYSIIYVTVYSDQASATDGLSIQQGQSPDSGTTIYWDSTDEFTVPAATGKTFAVQPALEYLRLVYTNGAVDQTEFRLHTTLKVNNGLDSSHRIQDSIVDDDDARLVKAVQTAKTTAGTFVNIGASASGNMKITDAENGLAIAKGDVTGTTFIHKFGNAPDFDTGDGAVTIWDGADDADVNQMVYQYSSTADIDSLSSTDNGDTQDIEIQGLDTNYDIVTQTITLTGQTRAALSTSLVRIFRMKNVGTTNNAGHVYCYVNTAITAGKPDDITKTRAVMQPGLNQTLMAVYTIPNGKTGYMRDWYAATSGGNKNASYIVDLFARPTGQVFQLKHRSALNDLSTAYIQHQYTEPEVFAAKTDVEMRVRIADASITAAGVSGGFDIVLVDD